MFDTHCHLNFKDFKEKVETMVKNAQEAGIERILVPGTDYETSDKAAKIAQRFAGVYAAVGIHPHHVYQIQKEGDAISKVQWETIKIRKFLNDKKVVAVGEVGLDKHHYQKTKYDHYQVDEEFVELQKKLLIEQIRLAIEHDKSLVLHNREAVDEFLKVLEENWDRKLEGKTVFHCCEPNEKLLEFAIKHKIYIGVDGDVTYLSAVKKQEFVKKIPLKLLVLETDSPFLVPEPLKSERIFPNQPANLKIISKFLSRLLKIEKEQLDKETDENSRKLFSLT